MVRPWWVLMLIVLSAPALAQQVGTDDATFDDGIIVTSADVLTCPYKFVQPVTVSATEDYGGGKDRAKIFAKLRNEAKKVAADGVVLVTKGGSHMTAFAWTRREYTGRAIRFVDRACAPHGD
ncbi:hypothetical protein ACFO0A_00660 [Novosphingobium tardum]|uniref:Uncharacterized protein n=1 Tax=Novosphingobium tardum TaxID=1538021 RepID=A0ABV8RJS1_9SPHN